MKVYAIHCDGEWTTEYNVAICSSKNLAEEYIKEPNAAYKKWQEEKNKIPFNSEKYLDFFYSNPQPYKYRIEELTVITNEKLFT
jgi:hypothetical protein